MHVSDYNPMGNAPDGQDRAIAGLAFADDLLVRQKNVLEQIVRGDELSAILRFLVETIEVSFARKARASILMVDSTGKRLLHGAAPSLPAAYNDAIHGIGIGPAVGSCGTAAFSGKRVIVEDIESDILWEDFSPLALSHDLRACWSTPIFNRDGNVIATFAVYYDQPVGPTPSEVELVDVLARTAGIAIERTQQDTFGRESHQQLLQIINSAPVAIIVMNSELRFVHVNSTALPTFASVADIQGRLYEEVMREVWPAETAEWLVQHFREVLETGKPWDVTEFTDERTDRHLREYYNWHTERIVLPGGEHGLVCYFTDTTASVVATKALAASEARLRSSEERLRAAISASGTGTFRWDIRDNSLDWDQALDALFGLPPGKTVRSLDAFVQQVHPDDRAAVVAMCQRCVAEGAPFDMEFRVVWPDGTIRWLHDKGKVFRDATGVSLYMTGACVDVTARKEANQELEAARDAAMSASRAKSTFLTNMSHELRTPLNAIIGYAQLLQEQEEPQSAESKERVDDLRKIEGAGRHLLEVINDVLDVAKIEAGKMQITCSEIHIRTLINEVFSTVGPLAGRNSNHLVAEMSEAPVTLRSDETRVRQIIYNLLSNACKFTDNGTITLRAARGKNGGVRFLVRDTGMGMNPEQLKLLFQEFSQVDSSTTRRHQGTGLGLVISRRLCHLLGGEISVTSKPGVGSTFTVELPNLTGGLGLV